MVTEKQNKVCWFEKNGFISAELSGMFTLCNAWEFFRIWRKEMQ